MGPQKLKSRKISVAATLIVISMIYAVWQNLGSDEQVEGAPIVSNVSKIVPSQNNAITVAATPLTQNPPPQTQPQQTQPQKPSGMYTDGTYTGTPVDAYYGTVQVQAVVQSGQLANVNFLQYPSDRSNSLRISNMAMPILTQEALQIQSAQVNGVSGATDTSAAFQQSLASALIQAKN